jgi:hypothetical protein
MTDCTEHCVVWLICARSAAEASGTNYKGRACRKETGSVLSTGRLNVLIYANLAG